MKIMKNQGLQLPFMLAAASLLQCGIAQAGFEIEEVVVTAQKRAQSLQDVGIAVSAFTGDQIRELGTSQPVELAAQTPNLVTKNALGNTAPIFSIRGISLNDFATNGTQPVGVYVDEVYLANNSQLSFSMFDTERVEVLKGPQGTLYGRNTTGGAVNFISRKPSEEFEADVSVTAAKYGSLKLEAAVGGELAPSLSGRFSTSIENQSDGFFTNDATGKNHGEVDRQAWRGQLLWNANDDVTALLNIHGGRDKSDNWYYALLADESGLPEGQAIVDADPKDGDIYRGRFSSTPRIDNDAIGGSLTIDWEMGDVSLRSISAYEQMDYFRSEDFDSTTFNAGNNDYSGDLEQYSQEFRLSGTAFDDWDWIVGAFYGQDDLKESDVFNEVDHPFFLGLTLNEEYEQETTSMAIYSHNEIQLKDAFKLTVGLRYTEEEREFVGGTVGFAEVDNKVDYEEVTGRIGLDYIVNEDLMLYSNYSNGYKAGGFTGFFSFAPEEKAPYEPEYIDAYEVGFKSTLLDSSLQFNGAAFYYEYEDLQAFAGVDGAFRIFNVETVDIKGLEMDLWWRPLEGLDIKAGAGYLDTEVTKSRLPDIVEGNELGNAPKLQFNALVGYRWNLSESLYAKVSADANWQDDVYYSTTNNPNLLQEDYTIVNARVIVGSVDDDWSVSLWGRNLSDKEYFGEMFSDGAIAIGIPGTPRTFGITLNMQWR